MSAPDMDRNKTMRGAERFKAPRPQATKKSFKQDIDQICDDKRCRVVSQKNWAASSFRELL